MKILVVEDEIKIANALENGLREDGFNVTTSLSGEDAFFLIQNNQYALVILDWMLPGRSGIEILRAIRSSGDWTPVIVLTAKDAVEDRVQGLEVGADDYLVKPFSFPELRARVQSLIRRNKLNNESQEFHLADLTVNKDLRQVQRAGQTIDLTTREYEILHYLLQHQGKPVTRDMLTSKVWKINDRVTSMDGVIDVHMNRLRGKLDKPFPTALIKTIRGVGFKICP